MAICRSMFKVFLVLFLNSNPMTFLLDSKSTG